MKLKTKENKIFKLISAASTYDLTRFFYATQHKVGTKVKLLHVNDVRSAIFFCTYMTTTQNIKCLCKNYFNSMQESSKLQIMCTTKPIELLQVELNRSV